MKRNELKNVLKPLIKECIKEVIFEDGTLSGIITEVAKGLGNVNTNITATEQITKPKKDFNRIRESVNSNSDIKKHLEESKKKLENSAGLKGIFEGTKPLTPTQGGTKTQHGALRDMDPNDAGVDISSIVNIAGNAWSQLK